ncbi:uncharacterized protein UDID_04415 [Ustilago sp. UG-2017a]|nr:uncharacterized protein UDID_04415 [Ustilago sp. UG-2017a]
MAKEIDHSSELHPPTSSPLNTTTTTTTAIKNASSTPPQPKPKASGPTPMSMPSILGNSGVASWSSSASSSHPTTSRLKVRSSGSSKELGRRKQRRSENARLLSNPHAVGPTLKDYRLHSNPICPTFSSLPSTLGKGVPVPAHSGAKHSEPSYDAESAKAGHFGKSLRDAHQILKRLEVGNVNDGMVRDGKAGGLERFIWLVDREIRTWAQAEIHLYPSSSSAERKVGRVLLDSDFNFTSTPFQHDSTAADGHVNNFGVNSIDGIHDLEEKKHVDLNSIKQGEAGQLIEFQRTANALVWLVHDPFLRLVVHCLARVSRCPSFSKDDPSRPGLRFTWILNRKPMARRSRRDRRVSVSSSAISAPTATLALNGARRPSEARAAAGGLGIETPPTTDFDSATESETGVESESEVDSLADSMTMQEPAPAEEETDQKESQVLTRVPRWPIDPHRQRDTEEEHDEANRTKRRTTKLKQVHTHNEQEGEHDPDATLTANDVIAEEDEDEVESYTSA